MNQDQHPDYQHLPERVPVEDTMAHQVDVEERYGGPGGGGEVVGTVADGADGD